MSMMMLTEDSKDSIMSAIFRSSLLNVCRIAGFGPLLILGLEFLVSPISEVVTDTSGRVHHLSSVLALKDPRSGESEREPGDA